MLARQASALLVAALAASSAWAADEGGYIGGGFGSASVTRCEQFTSAQQQTCGSATAVRVFGGYAFNRALAIEAGFSDLGSIGTTFELAGVVSLPLAERFALYGKLGAVSADSSSNAPKFGDATAGLGLRFDVAPRFAVRLEYQLYEDVDLATIGMLYRF